MDNIDKLIYKTCCEMIPGFQGQRVKVMGCREVEFPEEIQANIFISSFNDIHECVLEEIRQEINKILKKNNIDGQVTQYSLTTI